MADPKVVENPSPLSVSQVSRAALGALVVGLCNGLIEASSLSAKDFAWPAAFLACAPAALVVATFGFAFWLSASALLSNGRVRAVVERNVSSRSAFVALAASLGLGTVAYGLTVLSVVFLAASGTRSIFVSWGLAATVPLVLVVCVGLARLLSKRWTALGVDAPRRSVFDPKNLDPKNLDSNRRKPSDVESNVLDSNNLGSFNRQSRAVLLTLTASTLWALGLFVFEPEVFQDASVPAFIAFPIAAVAAFGASLLPMPRWSRWAALSLALSLVGFVITSVATRTPEDSARVAEYGQTSRVVDDLLERFVLSKGLANVDGAGTCRPGVAQAAPAAVGKAKDGAPDILLVTFDAMRWDHTSLSDYERDTTPNLKKWADEGVVFENAYSNSASTRQTFRSLLTGLLPSQLAPSRGLSRWSLSFADGQQTIASYLAAAGYRTISIQTARAVDEPKAKEFRGFQERDFTPLYQKRKNGYSADSHIDRMIAHLSEDSDQPRFVFTHLMEAHQPYIGGPDPKSWGKGSGKSKRDKYDSALHLVDRQLDRIISWVQSPERRKRTVLILSADHGMGLGERNNMKQHGNSLYDEQTHVPLLVFGKGVEASRVKAPATLLDLFPTIIDFAGLKSLDHVCGRSLVPVARGKKEYEERPVAVEIFPDVANPKFRISWVTNRYKLMLDVNNGSRMLYDLEQDPEEEHDLSPEQKDVVEQLEAELARFLEERGRPAKDYGLSAP